MRSAQIKVGVSGAHGRMGQEIAKILLKHKSMEPFYGLSRKEAEIYNITSKSLKKEAQQVDVWIDFSIATALDPVLEFALENKTPFVSGTTGITEKQKAALKQASKTIPVLWASNMSIGVAVLTEAMKSFSAISDFNFQIEEIHHKDKVDKPSGTALMLQESLEATVGRQLPAPLSIRGGGVIGTHRVWAISDEEQITFEHQALSRTVFARGAVRAAEWILNKKPGLYTFRDVLLESGTPKRSK